MAAQAAGSAIAGAIEDEIEAIERTIDYPQSDATKTVVWMKGGVPKIVLEARGCFQKECGVCVARCAFPPGEVRSALEFCGVAQSHHPNVVEALNAQARMYFPVQAYTVTGLLLSLLLLPCFVFTMVQMEESSGDMPKWQLYAGGSCLPLSFVVLFFVLCCGFPCSSCSWPSRNGRRDADTYAAVVNLNTTLGKDFLEFRLVVPPNWDTMGCTMKAKATKVCGRCVIFHHNGYRQRGGGGNVIEMTAAPPQQPLMQV